MPDLDPRTYAAGGGLVLSAARHMHMKKRGAAFIGKDGAGAKLILIVAMMVGGSAGSTAGGIKMIRMIILFRLFYLLIQRAGAPKHAVLTANLNGRKLEINEIFNAASLFVLFICITMLSWLPFVIMGHDPLNSLFEVVSALGTAGLSSGITSADLHPLLKGVLCAYTLEPFGKELDGF